ncbi:unnamed protein product [Sympodiomycopsis kandeliae]
MASTASSRLTRSIVGPQLEVNGRPFLCLPGELQNSSFSSTQYMDERWDELKDLSINTLLASVSWETIEPKEGIFEFTVLDHNIRKARDCGLKLVLLWFGSYKNGRSTYVPPWVKKDNQRFPRSLIKQNGCDVITEVLSPFCACNWQADAKAFAHLMQHLREVDGRHATVILVQVENEPGLLGDAMDRSSAAQHTFTDVVPEDFVDALRARARAGDLHPSFTRRFPDCLQRREPGSWEDYFGKHAEEACMAFALSRYLEEVAAHGKRAYDLPMFVNTWLNCDDVQTLDLHGIPLKHNMSTLAGGGARPGDYPSGGACPHAIDIWKVNAPSLDFLAPDVYLHDYEWVCTSYRHGSEPLFIPEQRRDAYGMRRLPYAYVTHHAIGCSPFGVDTATAEDRASMKRVFGLLDLLSPWILQARFAGTPSFGFFFDEVDRPAARDHWRQDMGEFSVVITRAHVFGRPGPAHGFVIMVDDGKYLVAGEGFCITFRSLRSEAAFTGIATADEMIVTSSNGQPALSKGRRLNGDETRSGESLIMPNENPDYGGFPIAITVPAETRVAECVPYWLSHQ